MTRPADTDVRLCARCQEARPLSQFRALTASRSGLGYWCKPCQVASTREWRARNRVTLRETKRLAYRAVHPFVAKRCQGCSVEFIGRRTDARYCSETCKRRATHQRAIFGTRVFPKARASQRLAVCERDGWICGLCHEAIDPALKYPHPGSASLDHIDPFGPHEPANWQAAHLACNVQAGRKGLQVASR